MAKTKKNVGTPSSPAWVEIELSNGDGLNSHKEGLNTRALGKNSHAEGSYTIAGVKAVDLKAFNVANKTVTTNSPSGANFFTVGTEYSIYSLVNSWNTPNIVKATVTATDPSTGIVTFNVDPTGGVAGITIAKFATKYDPESDSFNNSNHAEGIGTYTLGLGAHAEGLNTRSSDFGSHSEGIMTNASAMGAHAEGNKTTTIGLYGHSEGDSTLASGDASHAEGVNTIAQGKGSHAEGAYTFVLNDYGHVEGNGSVISMYATVATIVGNVVTFTGFGSQQPFNPTAILIKQGQSPNTGQKFTVNSVVNTGGSGNTTLASVSGLVVGDMVVMISGTSAYGGTQFAHAEGQNTLASGTGAHSEGIGTAALRDGSHTEGYQTIATGFYAHTEGYKTKATSQAAHAEGDTTVASNYNAHAEGWHTVASGNSSHAEGLGGIASGDGSHAEGSYTVAEGTNSHAEGDSTKTSGSFTFSIKSCNNSGATSILTIANTFSVNTILSNGSTVRLISTQDGNPVVGTSTVTSKTSDANNIYVTLSTKITGIGNNDTILESAKFVSNGGHAEGYSTISNGTFTHAEGNGTIAFGDQSHAEGFATKSIGSSSHSEGSQTTAVGNQSHAQGSQTIAFGDQSHAEGYMSKASGSKSHAEGDTTEASGDASHAEGFETTASGDNSHAQNTGTVAKGYSQTAIGMYNIEQGSKTVANPTDNVFIIGNGTDDSERSNAMTVKYNGDTEVAGKMTATDFVITGNATATSVNLNNGLQVVNSALNSPVNALSIKGRTLVNVLGTFGNCESITGWAQNTSTLALDTTNKTIGSSGLKVTMTGAQGGSYRSVPSYDKTKTYIALVDIKNGDSTSARILLETIGGGAGVINGSLVTSTTSFVTSYIVITPANFGASTGLNIHGYGYGSTGKITYYDAFRMYEITTAEATAIASMTTAQIAAKYPYVDDVKHVNSPYVIKYGENLLPTFNEWVIYAGTPQILEPYKVNVSLNDKLVYANKVIVGQVYSVSTNFSDANGRINVSFSDSLGATIGTPIDVTGTGLQKVENLIVPANAVNLEVRILGTNTAMTTASNPIVNIGATAKSFKPRNDDMLAFPNAKLVSNVDGTVYDTLFERDGKFFVEKRFSRDVGIDSGTWQLLGDYSGFKSLTTSGGLVPNAFIGTGAIGEVIGTKFDGKPMVRYNGTSPSPDMLWIASDGSIRFSVSDVDSGWGENYNTPTAQEIQAYLNGWVMYDISTGNPANKYNGTGSKGWAFRLSTFQSTGGVPTSGNMAGGVGSVPTSIAPSRGVFNPYRMTYQLATSALEEIQVEGSLALHEGSNQIEVGQGLIVREKANPQASANYFNVNAGVLPLGLLKYKTARYLGVYKNGKLDSNWSTSPNADGTISTFTRVPIAIYDPTATYEVSYIALDQHLVSSSVQSVTGEVANSIKGVANLLSESQSDLEARVGEAERLAKQIYTTPQKTVADMNIYVSNIGTVGNDANDNNSLAKPYKTIARAIRDIPQVVNHNVTIFIDSGTYPEDVFLQGYIGSGVIYINNSSSGTVNIPSFNATRCQRVVVIGLRSSGLSSPSFAASNCSAIDFNGCFADDTSSFDGFTITNSKAYITNCTIGGRLNAVNSATNSEVTLYNNNGSSNSYLYCTGNGGKISIGGTQPTGSITYSATANNGVVNAWGENSTPNKTGIYLGTSSNQAITANVLTKIAYPLEWLDNLSEYDNTNYRFTAKNNGRYLFEPIVRVLNAVAGNQVYMYLHKNGTLEKNIYLNTLHVNSNYTLPVAVSTSLNAGDFVEIFIYSTNNVTIVGTEGTPSVSLSITRIS